MGKRRPAVGKAFDPTTDARLRAVGAYDLVPDRGSCEIHFGPLLAAAEGLPAFDVSWFTYDTSVALPAPDDGLFALWGRYRTAHPGLCEAYCRLLFGLFSSSAQARYDDRQWRLIRRTRPTERDLSSVVTGAQVELYQRQERGESAPAYEVQVSFAAFWDEHGVAVRLHESGGGFVLGEWSAIGDL